MTPKEFDQVLDRRIKLIRETLQSKATEYATDDDRLYNFKQGARVLNTSPFQTLAAYMTKHIVSVMDIVEKRAKNVHTPQAVIQEKIGDTINYLILLEAMFAEDRNEYLDSLGPPGLDDETRRHLQSIVDDVTKNHTVVVPGIAATPGKPVNEP